MGANLKFIFILVSLKIERTSGLRTTQFFNILLCHNLGQEFLAFFCCKLAKNLKRKQNSTDCPFRCNTFAHNLDKISGSHRHSNLIHRLQVNNSSQMV